MQTAENLEGDSLRRYDKIIDLSTKVVFELFKTLWQRKSFWESALKSVK